jgi:hypothetical protein
MIKSSSVTYKHAFINAVRLPITFLSMHIFTHCKGSKGRGGEGVFP